MMKKVIALLLALTMVFAMAACGEKKSETPAAPAAPAAPAENNEPAKEEPKPEITTFTIGINYMPDNLSPIGTGSDDYTSMTRPIFDNLFVENTKGGLDYYLADEVTVSDDGLTYHVHLNDKATWSDGVPVTVDDLLFNINRRILKYGSSNFLRVNGEDATYEVIDDKTIEFHLASPYAYYIATLSGMTPYPSHVFDNDPQKMIDDTTMFTKPGFVTSGPYVVSEINADNIVFTARDDYYRGVPQVKTVVMKVIGSGSTKTIAFENGEIDYMRLTTKEELEKYSAQSDKYNVASFSEARLNYLQINPYGPAGGLTEDQRKAIFMAIDGDEVIMGAYGTSDLAVNPNSLLCPEQYLYDAATPDYEFKLEEAKALAETSGLKGKTLVYIYNADRANMEAVAVVLQQQLSKIGVNLDIRALDSTSFFKQFFGLSSYHNEEYHEWDLGTNGWDNMKGSTLYQAYSYLNQSDNAWGLTDVCGDLAVKVNTITDKAEQKKLSTELIQLALDQYRIYPLTYTNFVMVSQKNVKGLDCAPYVPEFVDYLGITVNN